jgi:pimeloyl-ACP methyl ester carboxylesterase
VRLLREGEHLVGLDAEDGRVVPASVPEDAVADLELPGAAVLRQVGGGDALERVPVGHAHGRPLDDDVEPAVPKYTLDAAARLTSFDNPVLIAWSTEDRFLPTEHAERLAKLLPDARLEWIEGARAFSPEDRPERLAELIGAFVPRAGHAEVPVRVERPT